MSRQIMLYILILSGIFGYSQNEKMILSNQVEVEFIKEKRKGTKIVLSIEKPECFQDVVTVATIDKVLEDYSKRSSHLKDQVQFYNDEIIYETEGGYEKAILDLKNFIRYFNVRGSVKTYLTELTRFSKEKAIKGGGIEEYTVNQMYPNFSYPLLEKNITDKKIMQLSEQYRNTIGTNNIGIKIFGKRNDRETIIEVFERSFKQLGLREVNLNCEKVEVSQPFFIHKPFLDDEKQIEMYSVYTQNEKVNTTVEEALIQTFGKENIRLNAFDHFSEIHIFQKANNENGKVLLERLKLFAKSHQLDFKRFGTVVSGNPKDIYESFKTENITYLNKRGDTITNPFVYKNVDLTGKEIVDRYLDAIGDKKFIESIHNTRTRYGVVINNDTLNLKVEFLNVLPHRKLRKMILNDKEISYSIFDGYQGWVNKKGVITDYDDEKVAQALAEESVLPQQFYSPEKIEVEGMVIEDEDKHYYKIKVSLDNYIVYEYYHPTSGLLMKREFCKELYTPVKTVYYSSYARLGELIVPYRLRILESNQELKLTLVSYNYNSFVESDEFAKIDRFKSSVEENLIDLIEEVEKKESGTTENFDTPSSEIKSGNELPDPFEGIEIMQEQVKQSKRVEEQYVENQEKFDQDSKRAIKYLVVLATMRNKDGAEIMLKGFREKGFNQAENIEMNGYYYTIEGTYLTEEDAKEKLNEVSKINEGTWILKREH